MRLTPYQKTLLDEALELQMRDFEKDLNQLYRIPQSRRAAYREHAQFVRSDIEACAKLRRLITNA